MRLLPVVAVLILAGCATSQAPSVDTSPIGAAADLGAARAAGAVLLGGSEVEALMRGPNSSSILRAGYGANVPAAWTVRPDGSLCANIADLRTCRFIARTDGGFGVFTQAGRATGYVSSAF